MIITSDHVTCFVLSSVIKVDKRKSRDRKYACIVYTTAIKRAWLVIAADEKERDYSCMQADTDSLVKEKVETESILLKKSLVTAEKRSDNSCRWTVSSRH